MSENDTETVANESEEAGSDSKKTRNLAPSSLLQRESDMAARPGFRNPANSRAKAMKKKR
jgi:hypothetical protein